jgi:hypothetical protein
MFRRPSAAAESVEALYWKYLVANDINQLPSERLTVVREQFVIGFHDGQLDHAKVNIHGVEADAYAAGWQAGKSYHR